MQEIEIINGIFAIISFFAWSVGFYFQIFITHKSKSGDGVCINFQILSMTGTFFFAIYNTYFVITKKTNFETIIDMLLAQESVILSIIILCQTLYYKRKINFINKSTIFSIFFISSLIAFFYYYGIFLKSYSKNDFYLFLGLTQSVICVQKYVSQVELNFFNKSVEGYSIEGVFGDLTGALLMLLQFLLNSVFDQAFKLNMPKLSLAVISIFFDFLLIYQKYYYRKRIREGLLGEEERSLKIVVRKKIVAE